MSFSESIGTEWILKLTDKVTAPLKQLIAQEKESDKWFKEQGNSIDELEKDLKRLEATSRKTFDPKQLASYNREMLALTNNIQRAKSLGVSSAGRSGFGGMGGGFGQFAGQLPGVGGLVGTNPYAIGGAAVAGGLYFSNNAANKYLDYDKLISKSNVTARLNNYDRAKLRNELLAVDYIGGDLTDVPASFAETISKNGNVRQSLDITRTGVRGAKAGFTDLPTVTSSLTSSINNLGKDAPSAADLLDSFIEAQRLGAVEFKQLAQDVPSLLALRPKGTSYKDVLGSYSYLSTALPIDQANTDLQNLLATMGKKETVDRFDKFFGKNNPMFDKSHNPRGFLNTLDSVYKTYKKIADVNPEKAERFLGELIPDTQAKTALNSIFSNYDKFKSYNHQLQSSGGETDIALTFAVSDKDVVAQADQAWQKFQLRWGQVVAPLKLDIVTAINGYITDPAGSLWNDIKNRFGTKEGWLKTLKQTDITDPLGIQDWTTRQIWGSGEVGEGGAFKRGGLAGLNFNKPRQAIGNAIGANLPDPLKDALEGGITSSVSTDKTPRIINVNIENLVRELNVVASSGKPFGNIQEEITKIFVDAVRDGEIALGSTY